jgi:hypothetical protein
LDFGEDEDYGDMDLHEERNYNEDFIDENVAENGDLNFWRR